MAQIVLKDETLLPNFLEDETALCVDWNHDLKRTQFADNSAQIQQNMALFYCQQMHHQYSFFREGVVAAVFQRNALPPMPPCRVALSLGHHVCGHTFLLKSNRCFKCDKKGPVKKCVQCNLAYYCSKECQAGDWKAHKVFCKTVRDDIVQYERQPTDRSDADLVAPKF